jgi:hypothetical protein
LELKGDLANEVVSALNRVNVPVASADPETLWEGLDQWSGRENLEERMIRAGWIDPVVLDVLRRRAQSDD